MKSKNKYYPKTYTREMAELLKLVKHKGILVETMEKGTPFIFAIHKGYKKSLGAVPVKNIFGNIKNVYLVYEDFDETIKYYDYPQ